jgi:hypothetical protein
MMDELAQLYDYDHNGPFIVKLGAGDYTPKYARNNNGTTNYTAPLGRDSTFILRPGVAVLGGYPPGGGATQDPFTNPTTLSGDIGTPNDMTDNAYHVVLAVNIPVNSGTALDGLRISGGYADGSSYQTIIGNDRIDQNYGGGMWTYDAAPTLTRVTISGNYASSRGGGMYNTAASGMVDSNLSPVLTNVTISGNAAAEGGGVCNSSSWLVLTNVTISGNKADVEGGGMRNHGGRPQIRNSIIWGNVAVTVPLSSSFENFGSTPVISYSIVEGSFTSGSWNGSAGNEGAAGSNKDTDPLFMDWKDPATYTPMPNSAGDYRLKDGSGGPEGNILSPAIDAGDNDYYDGRTPDLSHITTDLDNTARIKGTAIDMGAYEKQ